MKSFFLILVGWLICLTSSRILAETDGAPAPTPTVSPSRGGDSSSATPKKGTFYLSIFDPYPATFGVGITHFISEHFGIVGGIGKGTTTVYSAGFRLRPVSGKVSPLVGMNLSLGEDSPGSQKGFLYVSTGIDWKWDSGLFMHFGADWGMTPHLGQTEMKPYIQFGACY